MEIIARARQAGKTTELLKRASGHPEVIIIVPLEEQKRWLLNEIKLRGIDIKKEQIVTAHEVEMKQIKRFDDPRHPKVYLADDVDFYIERALGFVPDCGTITGHTGNHADVAELLSIAKDIVFVYNAGMSGKECITNQGQVMDGYSQLANYNAIAERLSKVMDARHCTTSAPHSDHLQNS